MSLRISPTTKLILLALIILIGAFFRFYRLSSLPPGDSYDPAYYGLDALRMRSGELPVYLGNNFGREAMFSYIVAGTFALLGVSTFGIHLAAAFISLLTLPAVYLAADELFRRDRQTLLAAFGGLVAALILALSFWHLAWSRYSVRAILIPLFISLLCFFLLRALRTQRSRYFLLTGLVMGVSFYTYQLAQLFPVLVGLGLLYELAARRSLSKKDGLHILLVYGTALVIALPLVFYAASHPGVFNQRVGDVFVLRDPSSISEQLATLGQNAWRVVKMYTVEGDTNLQINIPQRPSLNPLLALFLMGGVGLALYRWRRPQYLFLLTWLALMSAPAFLADDAALSKRALGALPAAIILITLALLWPLDWLQRRQARSASPATWPAKAYALLLAAVLLFTGLNTFRDYFVTWASDPGLYTAYDVGIMEIGAYISTLPASETIYLSPSWGDHASLRLHANDRSGIRTYDGNYCIVYPQQTTSQTSFLVITSNEDHSLPFLQRYFPQGRMVHDAQLGPDGLKFVNYQVPAGVASAFQPQHAVYANWNDELSLLGYDLSGDTFQPGDTLTLTLYFQPLTSMSAKYTTYLHLLGAENSATGSPLWAQVDREPCFQSYPTTWWREGEIIQDTFQLTLPPDLPPGSYTLTSGFYLWPDLTQLNIVATDHERADQAVILQPIEVVP
ncbi:MAG: glycosyltransferase family 39 protein [Ardenticatenaceae bacterium]|nr:glycosyltransferase family 39 protein [Ardenticatenaceae bacterium]